MKTTTRPEHGFEHLLAALERDLLDATDEEIRAVANELGIKPGMKGSIALLGVTSAVRLTGRQKKPRRQGGSASSSVSRNRTRGGPKGGAPSST